MTATLRVRPIVWRGQAGFIVSGTYGGFREADIFCFTREAAEETRAALATGIGNIVYGQPTTTAPSGLRVSP